jgi:hypothetical protein
MNTTALLFALALLSVAPSLYAQAKPTTDTLKQTMNRRLQSLKPTGTSERNVLFGSVQAGPPGPGSYPFQVTVDIRDYGPGYPPNHFYGATCVGRLSGIYRLWTDDMGKWQVDGAMSVLSEARKCKDNPSAGVSSIPLSTLSGSVAPAGEAAAPAPATAAGGAAVGAYECWANGQPRLLMNFQIRSATAYIGADGKPGTYSVDPTGKIAFRGGALDGIMPAGFSSRYYSPQGRPTVSYRGPGGGEATFCERAR